jgi:hypothetical protein
LYMLEDDMKIRQKTWTCKKWNPKTPQVNIITVKLVHIGHRDISDSMPNDHWKLHASAAVYQTPEADYLADIAVRIPTWGWDKSMNKVGLMRC